MVLVGLLFSLSAGVRITLPLLALNLLAAHGVITLPSNLAWLGTTPTLILLGVAFVVETLVHFVPVVGTSVKAASTPLAFVAGTLLMAVPLVSRSSRLTSATNSPGNSRCSQPSSVGAPSGRVGWESKFGGLATTRKSASSATISGEAAMRASKLPAACANLPA